MTELKTEEALEICKDWFAYLDRQRAKSLIMQKLAVLARVEPMEAQRRLRQLDTHSVTVFDGMRLEPAVKHLVKLCSAEPNHEA
jgi:hypothetical protein